MSQTHVSSPADEIRQVIERWRVAFEKGDKDGLKALWDKDHETVTYLATEHKSVLTGWEAVDGYYGGTSAPPESGRYHMRNWWVGEALIDLISDDVAFAVVPTYFTYRRPSVVDDPLHIWEGRASFTFHRRDGSWKVIHYEDSTLAQWLVPSVMQYRLPAVQELRRAIEAGDVARALEELEAFSQRINNEELSAIAEARSRDRRPS